MMHAIEARPSEHNPTSAFVAAVVAYVALLSAAAVLNSGLLRALSYAAAFIIFLMMLVIAGFLPKKPQIKRYFGPALALYYLGLTCSIAVNSDQLAFADLLKMYMGPAFLLFGWAFEAQRERYLWEKLAVRQAFWCMALMPLAVGALQVATGMLHGSGGVREAMIGGGGEFSIFTNRNNAALYAVAMLAFYNVLSGKPVRNIFIILVTGAAFATLGVLAAVVVALSLTVFKWKTLKYAVPLLLIFALGYFIFPDSIVFKRVKPVVDSIQLLYSGRIDLNNVTFGQLVLLLQTQDLSFLFRLKHWLNLWTIYTDGAWYHWLFGYGVGASVSMSQIHLVPHNDYLRFLFECGLVTLLGFVSTIVLIVGACGRRWETVPLLAISLYFFSENLVNNYLAMALFYFCAGALTYRTRTQYVDIQPS